MEHELADDERPKFPWEPNGVITIGGYDGRYHWEFCLGCKKHKPLGDSVRDNPNKMPACFKDSKMVCPDCGAISVLVHVPSGDGAYEKVEAIINRLLTDKTFLASERARFERGCGTLYPRVAPKHLTPEVQHSEGVSHRDFAAEDEVTTDGGYKIKMITRDPSNLAKIPHPANPVVLASGGPVMNLESENSDYAVCSWLDDNGNKQTSVFNKKTLYKCTWLVDKPNDN